MPPIRLVELFFQQQDAADKQRKTADKPPQPPRQQQSRKNQRPQRDGDPRDQRAAPPVVTQNYRLPQSFYEEGGDPVSCFARKLTNLLQTKV